MIYLFHSKKARHFVLCRFQRNRVVLLRYVENIEISFRYRHIVSASTISIFSILHHTQFLFFRVNFIFLWGLRDNVRCSSWAHWKARSGLPISVNWTFFARCYGCGDTGEYRLKIGDFTATGVGWPKILRRRGRPTNHFSSQKTTLNDLAYGI